jgi:hypothetical protein
MPNEPLVSSAARPTSGPLIGQTSVQDFVTTLLPKLYPIVVFGKKDTAPTAVKSYVIKGTASTPGGETQLIGDLTFSQLVALLKNFTFTVNGAGSYVITGTTTDTGTKTFNALWFSEIATAVANSTFTLNGQSYKISVTTEPVGQNYLNEPVGKRSLGYLTIGLKFMQFSITAISTAAGSPNAPVFLALDGNKGHGE